MRWTSTRDRSDSVSFLEAADRSLAAGGGLYLPEQWPRFNDIPALLGLDFVQRSIEIFDRIVGEELGREAVERIVRDAFDFPVPVVPIGDGTWMLDLCQGPTLAFKDFGARFLAGVLDTLDRKAGVSVVRPRTILTATSGDTGAAVAHAFWNRPGFRVVVLYPKGRISPQQERQFCTLGGNVETLAVEGSFDDAQTLVKRAFSDHFLVKAHRITSANSIHVARLLAQVAYYFEAVACVGDSCVVSVPSGNFGNLCAGLLAMRLGAPIKAFVAATNANDTVPAYLASGEYRPRASVATISNAMDVGAPSNWERIDALWGGDRAAMGTVIRSGALSDDATRDAMRRLDGYGLVVCPHTAVAHGVLRQRLHKGEKGVFLATADPAKFPEVVAATLGQSPDIPERLARFSSLPVLSRTIPADWKALADFLG